MSDADPHRLATLPRTPAPNPTHRLIASRFPPIRSFETVTSAADLAAVIELEGWTNDRLVEVRLRRLPEAEWVYGRANASIVMASFLHAAPDGTRFAGPDLGAWYASARLETAMLEVVNGVRAELARTVLTEKTEEYREYVARLDGTHLDLRGRRPDLHDPDPATWPHTQAFGEAVRAAGETGIVYDSVRDPQGTNVVCYRPSAVRDVTQARHFRALVRRTGKVVVERLDGRGEALTPNSAGPPPRR